MKKLGFVLFMLLGAIAARAQTTGVPGTPVPCCGTQILGTDGTSSRGIKTDSSGVVQTASTPPSGASATQVQGTAANGAATVGNPVLICGVNGGNCVTLLVDSSGRVLLGASGQTIGAVTQASGPWTTNETQIGSSNYSLGQALAASSAPVVLPALQLPNVGQAAMAASIPVAIASNQSSIPVTTTATATTPTDTTSNTSIPGPQSYTMIFNGTTWDRWKGITGQTGLPAVGVVNSGSNPADGTSQMFTELNNAGNSQLTARGVGYVFNNSTYDRVRSGDTANLTSRTGSQLTANVAIDPCQSSAILKSSVAISITSATTTQLVAPSGSTAVYVCGFDFTISEVITTANTLQFTTGTGATCAGSTVTKTGTYGAGGITVAAPIHISSSGSGAVFLAAASSGVCAVTAIGGTGSFQGILTFVQQ